MGRCKNCKYWPKFVWGLGNKKWRRCKKINENLIFEPHTMVYQPLDLNNSYVAVAIDQLVDTVELYTGENFGCIHFGRKTSLEDSIEKLGLSGAPLTALKNSGIEKVGDLVGRTPRELLVMRQVAEKSVQRIESQLEQYDLVERRDEDGCIHFERRGK